jgi:two-component system, chemotaxis family, chemotaxis protein CheY
MRRCANQACQYATGSTLRQAGWTGCRIDQACDGAQALAMVADGEPDLVLSDWHMPNVTGLELLRALRLRGYQMPFYFITSESSHQMYEVAMAAGALGLIAKPFTADSFRRTLNGM